MSESSQEQEPTPTGKISRRSLITKGPQLAAAAIALAAIKDSPNSLPPTISKEELRPNSQVIVPIFGNHIIGESGKNTYYDATVLYNPEELPQKHAWDKDVEQELIKLKPSIIALDGDNIPIDQPDLLGAFKTQYQPDIAKWFGLPGNPFSFKPPDKDLFFVMGELPNFKYGYIAEKKYLGSYASDEDQAKTAYKEYYEKLTGKELGEDPNIPLTKDSIANLQKAYLFETVGSIIGAGSLFSSPQAIEKFLKRKITRREGLNVAGILLALNAARLSILAPFVGSKYDPYDYPHPIPFDKDAVYKPYKLPFISIIPTLLKEKSHTEFLNFREAIVSAKLRDAQVQIPNDQRGEGPLVSVWGSGHKSGNNEHFSSKDKTQELLAKGFGTILKEVSDIIDQINEESARPKPKGEAMALVASELAKQLGAVGIVRFSGESEKPSKEEFENAWKPETVFISPTIVKSIIRAANNENIPLDEKTMQESLKLEVQNTE